MLRRLVQIAVLAAALAAAGCTNDPYPAADKGRKVLYSSFGEVPKTLDPAVSYTTSEHVITGNVYDTLLEYHYLERPFKLVPGLAEAVPEPEALPDGGQRYRFRIRRGVRFHEDPCFDRARPGQRTREVTAQDFAFQFARLADPAINSPVASSFVQLKGFQDFAKRLAELRRADAAFARLPAQEQYAKAGGIAGVATPTARDLEIVLSEPNAQILYWFAMAFTTPVPWEAVAYYDGREGRANFADQAVGTGPFRLAVYDKQLRYVLERNPGWYGLNPDAADAPGAVFPTAIDAADVAAKRIDPAYAGRRMPFLDRVNFTREREGIPRFNKFLQGYYDDGGIIKESFDAIMQGDRLSPAMAARGMRLDREVEPTIYYIGFNMNDPVLGTKGGEGSRKLRQAMSLAVSTETFLQLFLNGRGVPAQSPLPPGLFGYDARYRNPFRQPDMAKARALLAEAGYANGIDPATRAPLRLTFDIGNTSAQSLLETEFLVSAWRSLGLNVEIAATTYNQFQDKVRRGAYQIFRWGWVADYPDPENFLFLLECSNAQAKSNGPNTANFCNEGFDSRYKAMKDIPNSETRARLVKEMLAITETERPWIELFHVEDFTLSHAWLVNSKPMGLSYPAYKYRDVDPAMRERLIAQWNEPVRWPLALLIIGVIALVVPAVRTYYRERT
ncbi:MAG: ABC transporter substrate-binding protein [Hyphomicrobiaceae bacterium]|nr:ABC transporter substrate-binding protein [Hyphomicrobiaceae bacterium]